MVSILLSIVSSLGLEFSISKFAISISILVSEKLSAHGLGPDVCGLNYIVAHQYTKINYSFSRLFCFNPNKVI